MNFEEYKRRLENIHNEMNKKRLKLMEEFAIPKSPVNVGDFFTDHMGTIIVEKIRVLTASYPSCIYYGTCYTKKMKPFKSGEKRDAYQENIVNVVLKGNKNENKTL